MHNDSTSSLFLEKNSKQHNHDALAPLPVECRNSKCRNSRCKPVHIAFLLLASRLFCVDDDCAVYCSFPETNFVYLCQWEGYVLLKGQIKDFDFTLIVT